MKKRVLSLTMAMVMLVSLGVGPALQAAAATEPVAAPEQTEDGELPADTAGGAMDAAALTAATPPAEDEPAPVANVPEIYDLKFTENDASVPAPGTLEPIEDTNVLWVILTGVSGEEYKKYTYTLTGPGNVALGETKFSGKSAKYVYWTGVTFDQGGKYTLTIGGSDGTLIDKEEIEIYKVTFDADSGAFPDHTKKHVGYGMKDSRWALYNNPSDPVKAESGAFIGWSNESGATSYDQLINNAGAAAGSGYDVTVFAAYGEKRVWGLKLKMDGKELEPVAGTSNTYEITHRFAFDAEAEAKTLTLTVQNASTLAIPSMSLQANTPNYTLAYPGYPYDSKFATGASFDFILTPKSLGVGTYDGDRIGLTVSGNGVPLSAGITITIKTVVTGITVSIKPESITKEYGKTIDPNNVKAEIVPNNYSLSNLDVTLQNPGFAAEAEVNAEGYSYSYKGGAGYTIDLDESSKVTVVKATPETDGVSPDMEMLHVGGTLQDCSPTGTFHNPYQRDWVVPGDLTWDDPTQKFDEAGTYDCAWIFTPAAEYAGNYTVQYGVASVRAGEKPVPEITLTGETEFTYDGTAHPLTFTSGNTDDSTVTVKYRPSASTSEDDWTETAPVTPGTYTVRATTKATKSFAPAERTVTMTIGKATITVSDVETFSRRLYDGTRDVQITYRRINGIVPGDDVTVTVTGQFADKNAGQQKRVDLTYAITGGKDADKYDVKGAKDHIYAGIMTLAIKIRVPDGKPIEKPYGETLEFDGSMFEAEGLVAGESLKDQPVDYDSAGKLPTADVGEYVITAKTQGGNYTTGALNGRPAVEVEVGRMTVTPAAPDVSGVTVEGGSTVPQGTPLSDVKLSGAKDLKGEPLEGEFTWERSGGTVEEDGDYTWTFTPSDPNYKSVTGSTHLTLKDDTRTVSATVYNLPESFGYPDYAVVDIEKSGLRAGDELAFFTADGGSPVCGKVAITTEMLAAETVTVTLNNGALAEEGGVLTARIVSSKKHSGTAIEYKAEPGFTVAEKLTVPEGQAQALDITVTGGYTEYTVSVLAEAGGIITVENGSTLHATVRGVRPGSTALPVTVIFAHPDQTNHKGEAISVTKAVTVTVSARAGDVAVEVPSKSDVPATTIPETDQKTLQDELLTAEDKLALEQGTDVVIRLVVDDATTTVTAEDKAAVEACLAQHCPGYVLGQYLDVSLFKQVGSAASQQISSIGKPINLVFAVPQGLRAEGRKFQVVRVHGKETVVLHDLDSDPNTITIQTDRFSTYAIVYTDPRTPIVPPSGGGDPGKGPGSGSAQHTAPSGQTTQPLLIPATSDDAPLGMYVLVFVLALAGLAALVLWRRKKNKN